jgi:hypothetical protein
VAGATVTIDKPGALSGAVAAAVQIHRQA